MKWTDKEMKKAFGNLEDHNYKHFNRSLGIKVQGKEHFKEVLEKGNYVPYEMSVRAGEKDKRKPYDGVSDKTRKFLSELNATARKDGKITPNDRVINKMKEIGVRFDFKDPKSMKGGFSNE